VDCRENVHETRQFGRPLPEITGHRLAERRLMGDEQVDRTIETLAPNHCGNRAFRMESRSLRTQQRLE